MGRSRFLARGAIPTFKRLRTSPSVAAIVAVAVMGAVSPIARADAVYPAGFSERTDAAGGAAPVAAAYVSDGRKFLAEKRGRVRVVNPDGSLVRKPLLDIRDKVNSAGDRGLLGIAADVDFASNGRLYLLYVRELRPETPDSGEPMVSQLTRITVKPDNSLKNPSAPETVILGTYDDGPCPRGSNTLDCIPADAIYHTIGTVRSDPVDGTLWVGSGDATTPTQVQHQALRAQKVTSLAGKIIHIDRRGEGLEDHPFCRSHSDLSHVCTKVYARGFRNPFRFSLRPDEGPIVGDVGSDYFEELDLVEPGNNYGWPCYEGDTERSGYSRFERCRDLYALAGTSEGATPPVWTYQHGRGASIIAGPVIETPNYPPSYQGDIVVGDFIQSWLKRIEIDNSGRVVAVHEFASQWTGGVDLLRAPNGEIAYVDIGWAGTPSGLRRIHFSD